MPERVIGIDLGTTNSCVAIVEDGEAKVIPNRGSYDTTPSMIAIAETGRRLVGHMAKRQAITNAANTAFAFKRLIGRKWDSQEVKNLGTTLPYKITGGPNGDVRLVLRDVEYSISELSAFILQAMREVVEDYVSEKISKAVITVPAYFNDAQRQATKDAGKIAGLDVIRIINEPTAAALAYGIGKDIEKRVAIYDLGGGTFDISVLDIGNGVFEVITTAGDSLLGGEDFDRRIMDWLVFNFAKENHIDLRKDKMALQRLKDVSEKAKCDLSTLKEVEINLPFIISTGKSDPFHLQTTLSRDKLEQLTSDLVDRTIRICDESLKRGGIDLNSIDSIILVGGMTRMPIVQAKVMEYFKKEPSKGVHPDEVVALGAAIQGHALLGDKKDDILLLDVTPHSLGIKMSGGGFFKIIESNTTIPTSSKQIFTNVRDNQDAVNIVVFQGEDDVADNNDLLGEFTLYGLRRAPKGELDIEVSFDIDSNGIVKVTAKDQATGKEQAITISSSSKLSEDEIQSIIRKNSGIAAPAPAPAPTPAPAPIAPTAPASPAAAPRAPFAPFSSHKTPSAPALIVTNDDPLKAPVTKSTFAESVKIKPGAIADAIETSKFNVASPGETQKLNKNHVIPGEKLIAIEANDGSSYEFKTNFVNPAQKSGHTVPITSMGFGAESGFAMQESSKSAKLKEVSSEVEILFTRVEELIKTTNYGPEALNRAKQHLEKARDLLSVSTPDPVEENSCIQNLERTLGMFRSIIERLVK
ncbi:molecular chaperone DnaK [Myxococcota bacterium]|nr:molecular chaperone DnaK [Myxococcota bacterium]MBU1382040.1 molecular chaperone DnaK [Myxococcota bacterium]MBU1495318.1 molecular chaperone DnaK [Myxococcota bacterium]